MCFPIRRSVARRGHASDPRQPGTRKTAAVRSDSQRNRRGAKIHRAVAVAPTLASTCPRAPPRPTPPSPPFLPGARCALAWLRRGQAQGRAGSGSQPQLLASLLLRPYLCSAPAAPRQSEEPVIGVEWSPKPCRQGPAVTIRSPLECLAVSRGTKTQSLPVIFFVFLPQGILPYNISYFFN